MSMFFRGRRLVASFLACAWILAIAVQAQSVAPGGPVPQDATDNTVVVNVDVVNVFFNVRARDQLLRELGPQEFRLFEDNRPQEIRFFSAESQQPLTLAILVDSSSSQRTVLNKELEVGEQFLHQVLTPDDEALVLGFDSQIQLHQDFTNAPDNLIAAMSRALQGTAETTVSFDPQKIPKGRSTALYDAIVATTRQRMQQRTGHKAMLILTDGQDNGSRRTSLEAVEAAERSDVICYVLLVGDRREMASTDYRGIDRMNELAQATGGRMIMVGNDMEKLERSFNDVSDELRHFYSLGYMPDRKQKSGEYRKITLKSKHGYKVQARKGYYAVPKETKLSIEATH